MDGAAVLRPVGISLHADRTQTKRCLPPPASGWPVSGVPKNADESSLFDLYKAFASEGETAALRAQFENGIAWGEAKAIVHARIDQEIAPARALYQALMAHQRIPQDHRVPIRSLAAQTVLHALPAGWGRASESAESASASSSARAWAAAKSSAPV